MKPDRAVTVERMERDGDRADAAYDRFSQEEVVVSDAVKLCRDCKHLTIGDECMKSPKPVDFVHGKPRGFYPAQAERQTNGGCGPSARWWEAK